MRGKCRAGENNTFVYSLQDAWSVLDNVKNTPRYWKQVKQELLAMLENLGPFQFFFTLTAGDKRYPENFVTFLTDHNVEYHYELDKETVLVDGKPLYEFLAENVNQHEHIKENIVTATLNFHWRVKMFIKHIMTSQQAKLKVRHYGYKTEFQVKLTC